MIYNKKELARYLAEKNTDYHQYEFEDFLDFFVDAVNTIAVDGDEIKIENLGHFTQRAASDKKQYNFQTKQSTVIKGFPTLLFRVAPSLQRKIRAKTIAERKAKEST